MAMTINNHLFFPALVFITIMGFVFFSNCMTRDTISSDDAIRIALNDSRTVQAINSGNYSLSDVGKAHWGAGSGTTEEVYSIVINVTGITDKKILVLVTYDGTVVLVDTWHPMIMPPENLTNIRRSPISGKNMTDLKPDGTPVEIPGY